MQAPFPFRPHLVALFTHWGEGTAANAHTPTEFALPIVQQRCWVVVGSFKTRAVGLVGGGDGYGDKQARVVFALPIQHTHEGSAVVKGVCLRCAHTYNNASKEVL